MELSVVIPVYNEEENIEPLIEEIVGVLRPLAQRYEMILVDDGSKDRTFSLLARLCDAEKALKVVRLKRNFGQTAAMAAGLAQAQGDIVVMMDGDGQNDWVYMILPMPWYSIGKTRPVDVWKYLF